MTRRPSAAVRLWAPVLAALSAITLSAQAPSPAAGGRIRVIVELRLPSPHVAEGLTSPAAVAAQRREIVAAGGVPPTIAWSAAIRPSPTWRSR